MNLLFEAGSRGHWRSIEVDALNLAQRCQVNPRRTSKLVNVEFQSLTRSAASALLRVALNAIGICPA